MAESLLELHLKIFPMIGRVRYAVLLKMNSLRNRDNIKKAHQVSPRRGHLIYTLLQGISQEEVK